MTKKVPDGTDPDALPAEEARLFEAAMKRVRPRKERPAPPAPASPAAATPRERKPAPASPSAAVAGPAKPPGSGLDRRTADRLRRGKLTIDARLDLHGLTQSEAHGRLHRFILEGHARGRRCVLVITGKGQNGGAHDPRDLMPDRNRGVLRRQVPLWLRGPGLADKVVELVPARPEHGGNGALYVYLRRQR